MNGKSVVSVGLTELNGKAKASGSCCSEVTSKTKISVGYSEANDKTKGSVGYEEVNSKANISVGYSEVKGKAEISVGIYK